MNPRHIFPSKTPAHQAHNLKVKGLHLVFAQQGMDEAKPKCRERSDIYIFLNFEVAGNGRGEAEVRTAKPDAIAPQMPRIKPDYCLKPRSNRGNPAAVIGLQNPHYGNAVTGFRFYSPLRLTVSPRFIAFFMQQPGDGAMK